MSFCFTLGGRQAREGKGFSQGHRDHQCLRWDKIQSTHFWPRATLAISLKLPWRLAAQRPKLDFRRDRQEKTSFFWGEENPNFYVQNKGGKKSNYIYMEIYCVSDKPKRYLSQQTYVIMTAFHKRNLKLRG